MQPKQTNKKRNGKPNYEIRKANKVLVCLFLCFFQLVILSVPLWKFQETNAPLPSEISQDFGACTLLVTAWQCTKMLPPTWWSYWVLSCSNFVFFNIAPTPVAATLAIPCEVDLDSLSCSGLFGEIWEALWRSRKWVNIWEKVNEWVKPGALRSQQQVSLVVKEDLAHLRPGGWAPMFVLSTALLASPTVAHPSESR